MSPGGEVSYFTVAIEPGVGTKWHHPSSRLTRGAFDTKEEAEGWATEHLKGAPYEVIGIRTAVSDLLGLRLGESILFDQGSSVIEVTREEDPEGPYWETKDMETGERQTWSIMLELADWLEGR